MIVNNYYDINLYLFDKAIEVTPTQISFSIRDSIRSFYSTAELTIDDYTGLLKENPINIEGFKYSIQYGLKDDEQNHIIDEFIVYNDAATHAVNKVLNNQIKMVLINNFYSQRQINNQAYKGRISEVVSKLIQDYKFSQVNMNSTSNDGIWYRLFLDQKDFIEKVLLPNCFSENAFSTPFTCFLGMNNTFNFRNYYSMMTDTPIAELTLLPNSADSVKNTSIISITPFRKGSGETNTLRQRIMLYRDLDTGDVKKARDTLKSYPTQGFSGVNLPISGPVVDTDYEYVSWKYKKGEPYESYQGRFYYDQIDGFGLEKFIIITPLNTQLKSGKTVNLNLSILNTNNDPSPSLYYNDKYLIEECIHSWAGPVRSGQTQLLVSRKFIKPTSQYILKDKLL